MFENLKGQGRSETKGAIRDLLVAKKNRFLVLFWYGLCVGHTALNTDIHRYIAMYVSVSQYR